MIYNKLLQSINETNQESEYLQFCRTKAYCPFRIHCLLEAVCLTVNSTRPSPVTVYPLQVKFESIIIISNAQNSVFYTDYLATKCPISFIGHKVPYFVGHKVPYFFYWPQSAPFIGHKVACFFYWPHSGLFGHKVANAFALSLPHSLLLAIKWPMLLVLTLHSRIHCSMTI